MLWPESLLDREVGTFRSTWCLGLALGAPKNKALQLPSRSWWWSWLLGGVLWEE